MARAKREVAEGVTSKVLMSSAPELWPTSLTRRISPPNELVSYLTYSASKENVSFDFGGRVESRRAH